MVQPTPFCNIDCRYCYLPNRASARRMTTVTIDAIARLVFASNRATDPLIFLWHGGEPLTLPLSFYRQAFATIAARNRDRFAICHSIQTNGTLIDQEWCDLIREQGIDLGVSV